MTLNELHGPMPVAQTVDALLHSHGRLRVLLAVLLRPRPRAVPLPMSDRMRADVGLPPLIPGPVHGFSLRL